jgi:hypothetical protein
MDIISHAAAHPDPVVLAEFFKIYGCHFDHPFLPSQFFYYSMLFLGKCKPFSFSLPDTDFALAISFQ